MVKVEKYQKCNVSLIRFVRQTKQINLLRLSLMLFVLVIGSTGLQAQSMKQTVRGTVYDKESNVSLPAVTVAIYQNDSLLTGTMTDNFGQFLIENLTVGRYQLMVSCIGYEKIIIPELMVTSTKEVVIELGLKELSGQLDEVVVKAHARKEEAVNPMAIMSARMFTVEEANRYAGGFDDPARLSTAFAGVASTRSGSNAIVVRGNAPKGVLWSLEGIEIPDPNHFSGTSVAGGGFMSALSSQTLANSDFYTGAFPAEFGNALSGVFDMRLKTGNTHSHETGAKLGIMGAEFFSEGPLSKNRNASYAFNYRYSTFAIVKQLIPDMNTPEYQDLSFKLNFPAQKAGVFSLWGFGLIDKVRPNDPDSLDWEYKSDKTEADIAMRSGVLGLSHKIIVNPKAYVQTVLALTSNTADLGLRNYEQAYALRDSATSDYTNTVYKMKSFINRKMGQKASARLGVEYSRYYYDLLSTVRANPDDDDLSSFASSNEDTELIRGFMQLKVNLTPQLILNGGVNAQLFRLNNSYTLEPRVGLRYSLSPKDVINIGYGNHSRLEPIHIYFVEAFDEQGKVYYPNKELELTKAHHFGISYERSLYENTLIKVEGFYQNLYDVPVDPGGTLSMMNFKQEHIFRDALVNNGSGLNYGVEFSLEQFLNRGFYYLLTTTFYQTEYKDSKGHWHTGRYNYGHIVNALAGYEFSLKNPNNMYGINFRLTAQGGERHSPIDVVESQKQQDVVYDESRPYIAHFPNTMFLDVNLTYRINRPNLSTQIGVQLKNILRQQGEYEYQYNFRTNQAELTSMLVSFPNVFVRFDF